MAGNPRSFLSLSRMSKAFQGKSLDSWMNGRTVILDLNGTLSVHGVVDDLVEERLERLKSLGTRIILLSGDQRGTAATIAAKLGLELFLARDGQEKGAVMDRLGLDIKTTVSIGNARIDIPTFERASLRIATLQAEGIHADIIGHVDIIVPSIVDALDLLLDPDSLSATMRT